MFKSKGTSYPLRKVQDALKEGPILSEIQDVLKDQVSLNEVRRARVRRFSRSDARAFQSITLLSATL
jgi:hypothetical protein